MWPWRVSGGVLRNEWIGRSPGGRRKEEATSIAVRMIDEKELACIPSEAAETIILTVRQP
jgi:hypothetical protein